MPVAQAGVRLCAFTPPQSNKSQANSSLFHTLSRIFIFFIHIICQHVVHLSYHDGPAKPDDSTLK